MGHEKPDDAGHILDDSTERLAEYQDRLWAEDRQSLLVVLQAMDAAGKDSAIKHVMSGVNPQGCEVWSFKAPSGEELDHDYLWRNFRALPERGRIGIWNRSHYEEVLVVRVHPEFLDAQRLSDGLKGKDIWKRRFREINAFERYLVDNGTQVLKLFLHVSKDEQKERFLERIETPEKNWKFSVNDVKEREHWDDYIRAFEDVLATDEHRLGTLVRRSRRPQVVHPHRRLGDHRRHARGDGSAVSDGERRAARAASRGEARPRRRSLRRSRAR